MALRSEPSNAHSLDASRGLGRAESTRRSHVAEEAALAKLDLLSLVHDRTRVESGHEPSRMSQPSVLGCSDAVLIYMAWDCGTCRSRRKHSSVRSPHAEGRRDRAGEATVHGSRSRLLHDCKVLHSNEDAEFAHDGLSDEEYVAELPLKLEETADAFQAKRKGIVEPKIDMMEVLSMAKQIPCATPEGPFARRRRGAMAWLTAIALRGSCSGLR